MQRFSLSLLTLALGALSTPLLAGPIPYPNVGVVAPEVPTFASGSSGVTVYYFGSTASFTDYVEVSDLKTGYDSGRILNNHTTTVGSSVTVGTTPGQINAGDQLVFYIDSPQGKFASIAADSADGVNHAYITSYAGGTVNGSAVPAGLYVGLEDEVFGSSDLNYDDDPFVFTGVSAPSITPPATTVTPEPSSIVLLGTGLLSAAGAARRRMRSR